MTALAPGVAFGGWNLSVSLFGLAFAISYRVTARLRGAALLKSLNVGRELRSVRRLGSALLLGLAVGGANGLLGLLVSVINGFSLSRTVAFTALGMATLTLVVTPLAWLTGAFTEDPASGDTDSTGPGDMRPHPARRRRRDPPTSPGATTSSSVPEPPAPDSARGP